MTAQLPPAGASLRSSPGHPSRQSGSEGAPGESPSAAAHDASSGTDDAAASGLSLSWAGRRLRFAGIFAALLLAGVVALQVDLPLSLAVVQKERWLHNLLGAFEPFGQPTAILVTAGAIGLCDPRRRVFMLRLIAAALGAGLAADVVKLCVARTRPHHADLAGSVAATFQGAFPGYGHGSAEQSLPSAHTATAVGFALALWTLFPAGRWLWIALAAHVAFQRIETGAHFLSDTVFGAAVGYAVCLAVFRRELLGGWFDRNERARWRP